MNTERTLSELAEASGVPARTIRFYIARGLVPAPLAAGRAAAYGREHLDRLEEIKRLQTRGLTLAEIALKLGGGRCAPAPEAAAWWHYAVAGDVQVAVRADASPWRLKRIRKALEMFAAEIGQEETHAGDNT